MMTAKNVAQQLAQRAEDVCMYLLPNGKKAGHEWCIGNLYGDVGDSLKIHLTGVKAGVWSDFATGEAGDLLNLWVIIRNTDLSGAIKQACQWLGIGQTKFDAHRPATFKKPDQKKQIMLSPISDVFLYLTDERKLLPETLSAFNVGHDGRTIVLPYIRDGEIIQIKYIKLDRDEKDKKISWVEKDCEPCLFGWHLIPCNARSVTLCEGELDCMTLHQYGLPALSVPFGGGRGGKQKWLEYEFERLSIFDEVFLCFDNDSAGNDATVELMERLGRHRCRIVKLSYKDPNQCLQSGITWKAMHELFAAAKTLDPEELKQANTLVEKVISEFYPVEGTPLGYSPPWEKAKGKIIFRPAELSIVTGINGHGKSQLLGHIILQMMKQGARICIASLELRPARLLMRLTRQASGLSEPTIDYIRAIHQWYQDKLFLFDLVGTAKADRLLEVFLYARQRYGIDTFVIDSFLKLDISEDDYKAQKSFIEKLCDFKNQHNCHVFLVVHPRKALDESKAPGKLDNKGTGAISDLADNCFGVWRNKPKEELKRQQEGGAMLGSKEQEELKKPDCYLICDKQRNGDWEGRFALWFDPQSFQYLNHESQRPIQFVQYSTHGISTHEKKR